MNSRRARRRANPLDKQEDAELELALKMSLIDAENEENNKNSPRQQLLDSPTSSLASASSSMTMPSPSKKIKLKEQTLPQKINKHLSQTKSQRKASSSNSNSSNYISRQNSDKMPENMVGKLSTRQTLDWLHETGNNTIAAYSSKKISEESSAVKSDFGLLVGDLEENVDTYLPSIDQIEFGNGYSGFEGGEVKRREMEEGREREKEKERQSKESTTNDTSLGESTNQTDSDQNDINDSIDYLNGISNKMTQHFNGLMMNALNGVNANRNARIIEMRQLEQECASLEYRKKCLKEQHRILDEMLALGED